MIPQNHQNPIRYVKTLFTLLFVLTLLQWAAGSAQAQSAPEVEQAGALFLPFVQNGNASEPADFPFETIATDLGSCPDGYHLVNQIGAFSIIDPATLDETSDWAGYACRANQTLEMAACSEHGTPQLIGGVAACACDEGYVGAQCNVCGWGFAKDAATGQCVPQMPAAPAAIIQGGEQSIEQGQTIALAAMSPTNPNTEQAAAAQATVNGVWTIASGEGCLLATAGASECVQQINGPEAHFRAPSSGAPLMMTEIQFVPDCCANAPVVQTVIVQPPGSVPITGWGSAELEPILSRVVDYMVNNCAGAGVVGISYYGKPVGVWGMGKMDGRASSALLEPACGDNTIDPHNPSAANITPGTPMQIGSVSKTITFSVARWALKERLKQIDTDIAAVALSNERLLTAIRTEDDLLQLDSWSINTAGVQGHAASEEAGAVRDFDVARISDTRVLVGVRTQDNNLKMILWEVNGGGQLQRLGEEQGGTVKQVALASIGNNRVVAAVRQGDDSLKLIVWHVSPDGSVSRLGEAEAGRARDLDIAGLSSADGARVITAVRTETHALKLIVWDVNNAGQITRRGDIEEPGHIDGLQMSALSHQRVVVGIRTETGNLKVILWGINGAGQPARQGDDEAGASSIFALTPIGQSGFTAAARTQSGTLKIIAWQIDNAGEPTRRGDDEAGDTSSIALTNATFGSDTLQSIAFAAVRTQGGFLKIIPWDVTAPTPARLANEGNGDPVRDFNWTDADIEALHLFEYDIPEGLLPDELHGYFSGKVAVPVKLSAGESCPAPEQFADPQWQQITVKHLFGHRTGMPKSAYGDEELANNYLPALRGLDSQAGYAAQEQLMRDLWGDANVEASRAALGWDTGLVSEGATGGYIVPWVTLDEVLTAVAGRCLPNDLTQGKYSNTTPQIVMRMIEHISDRPYVAQMGYPETHEGSLVDLFFASQAGIETGPVDGIFARPSAVTTILDDPYPGPVGRIWQDGTYYPLLGDRKRPHCNWSNGSCSFGEWFNDTQRVNWGGAANKLPLILTSNGFGAATGGMAVEAEAFLHFMAQYWTGGYDGDTSEAQFDPWIGERRNNVWNLDNHHNGSIGGGGVARADQIADAARDIYGVDVFVAVNQNENKRCLENENAPGCADHLYDDVVKAGVNEVDWDAVMQYGLQLEGAP